MKILHIITCLGDGGAEAVLFRLIAYDTRSEHTVISLMDGGKYQPLLAEKGITVHTLDMPRSRVTVFGLWRLWQLIRRTRPDVIQTWMYHANLLGGVIAWFAGQTNIVWGIHHTDLSSGITSRSSVFVAKLGAWLSGVIPRRVVYCAETARRVHEAFGYCAARSFTVPNGYDLSVFTPAADDGRALRAALGIASDRRVIGFVARFDPLKDHVTLLDALVLLRPSSPTALCLLVGTGMVASNALLAEMIASRVLSGMVALAGRRDDIPAVMNALDVHVMSSMCEAFPNVLAEAMACGTPCVTTDVGDAAMIVGETGWVVPPGDAVALAEAIDAALTEHDKQDSWRQRQQAARARIEETYSIERVVRMYRSVWQGEQVA